MMRLLGLRFDAQNLSGRLLTGRHGRCWIRRAGTDGPGRSLCVEWRLGTGQRWLGAEMALFEGDDQRGISLSLGLWFAAFSFFLNRFLPARYAYPRHAWPHETGIRLWGDFLIVQIHHASDCHDCAGWPGVFWGVFLRDLLFGPARYSEQDLYTGIFTLSLAEGEYRVEGRLVEVRWKRARWPWPQILRRAHLECRAGIPISGKGENAWDLDGRPLLSFTCNADTLAEGVETLQNSVIFDRQRIGGAHWRPAKK